MSLREYFERQLDGEVVNQDNIPVGYTHVVDGGLLSRRLHAEVLDRACRLPGPPSAGTAEIVFVQISAGELSEAKAGLADAASSMLSLDLRGRAVSFGGSPGAGAWIAVSCPKSYLRDGCSLQIPPERLISPCAVRATVHLTTVTPCSCRQPIGGVLVAVNGRRCGLSGAGGVLELPLPRGANTIEILELGEHGFEVTAQKVVDVSDTVGADLQRVEMCTGGRIYAKLLSRDPNPGCLVKPCAEYVEYVEDDDDPFKGMFTCWHKGRRGKASRNPALRLREPRLWLLLRRAPSRASEAATISTGRVVVSTRPILACPHVSSQPCAQVAIAHWTFSRCSRS
jgi:hypothetical protein